MFKSIVAFSVAAVASAAPAVEVTMRPGFDLPPALFPSPKASCHFEDPFQPAGCQAGEVNITITGITGSMCTPKCDATGQCPTDVCEGTVATPTCALQDQSGNKYCALICDPSKKNGTACSHDEHMACHPISGTGVCTYYS